MAESESEASSSSRDPLNVPPVSGGPPPYRSPAPPPYQEALGLLSVPDADGEVNDSEPPQYLELRPMNRNHSDEDVGSEHSHSSLPAVEIIDPHEEPREAETAVDGEAGADVDVEAGRPAGEAEAEADSGTDNEGRVWALLRSFLTRLRRHRRFLIVFPLVLTAVVLFLAIFPVSFHYIHYHEIALKKSAWTGWVDFERTYYAGCYVVGPEMEFIRFNATWQTIDQRLSVTSSSSLSYQIDVVTVYRIKATELPQLYRKFAGEHEAVLRRAVVAAAKNRAVSIHVDSWLSRRRESELALEAAVAARLNASYHVQVRHVLLIDVSFPAALLARLMAQEQLILYSVTAEHRLEERVEQIRTRAATADVDNAAREVAAAADAQAGLTRRRANAEAALETTRPRAEGLNAWAASLGLAKPTELMSAYFFAALRRLGDKGRLMVAPKNVSRALVGPRPAGPLDNMLVAAAGLASP